MRRSALESIDRALRNPWLSRISNLWFVWGLLTLGYAFVLNAAGLIGPGSLILLSGFALIFLVALSGALRRRFTQKRDAHPAEPVATGLLTEVAKQMQAEVQHLLDSETAARGTSLVPAARLLRTELLDIRHKIEMLKIDSTLSDGFAFPASEWDAQRQLISRDQALYEVVERAYTTAHRVNEIWRWRRTQSTARLIGANLEEDGLDGVDKAALDAIQALERVIEPDKPLHERYSVQEAARELEKDATLETLAGLIREGETLYDSRAGYDQWIANHAAWRERLQTELTDADRIRAFDFAGLSEGDVAHEKDLRPARLRVDRIVGNLRKLHD